jgi:hypothetical protein
MNHGENDIAGSVNDLFTTRPEVDRQARIWTVPNDRMKRVVPIVRAASAGQYQRGDSFRDILRH